MIPRRPEAEPAPLSFAQQRLWFLAQWEPDSPYYNIPCALRLTGALDVAALRQSLTEILRRHDALRTTFVVVHGQPVQVIGAACPVPLVEADLSTWPPEAREAEALRRATEDAQRPFDLAHGPLLRPMLLRFDAHEHLLLLTMHHIVSDGWSVGVLFEELGALYTAFSSGEASPLPPLPIQYADFAHWQRQWLRGEVLDQQLAYWQQQLVGPLPVLALPMDHPRPATQTVRGASLEFALSRSLSEALAALSRHEHCTLFMTLLAAFQTLLHRYSGQDNILVGSPIANRTRPETEPLIGCFINTLVFRTRFAGLTTFRQLLHHVRDVALDAYTHQDLPFERLVEALHPDRELSHSPLFQVMFVFHNAPGDDLVLPGLTVIPVDVDTDTAAFDLTLTLQDTADGLAGSLEFNSDLFEAATIHRLVGHLSTLLAAIVADPDHPLATLPLLTDAERQQLLVEWNATAAPYPADQCVHQLFEAQAARTPDALAVASDQATLTYDALNRRANQWAYHLRALGVGPDVLVGLCVERSLDMLVALLAILKAGGAYVPLDPTYPRDRLAFMLADAHISVLLTQSQLVATLPATFPHVLCLDAPGAEVTTAPDHDAPSPVTPDHLVYVIYTSGSTGTPKGVMMSHRAVCDRLTWMQDALGLTDRDRLLQRAPLGFDVSAWELFWPLIVGGQLVLPRPGGHADPSCLVDVVIRQGVTIICFVPSLLQMFLDDPRAKDCVSLRTVICGGEALSSELLQRFFTVMKLELHNMYGPTEACFHVTCWTARPGHSPGAVPIGRPIANTELYVLDAHQQLVPVGVPGELYIGGLGLARGYLHQPGLTAERFVPHPFRPDARLYRTGDLVRYRPDGNLDFLGRLDDQVKIRGFRIELGEIEAVLARHAGVREVAVLAREDHPGDKRLVAYVVPRPEATPTLTELRDFARTKLPDYMLPAAVVFLDAFPLTTSGKIDRRALPAPSADRPVLTTAFVAPRSSLEDGLARVWAELLHLEHVGVHDNFFDLGGHSLLATQLVVRLRDLFHVDVPLRRVFETPTIAGLVDEIERATAGRGSVDDRGAGPR